MELKKNYRGNQSRAPGNHLSHLCRMRRIPGRALSGQVLLRGQCKKAEDQSVHGQ